MYPSIIPSNGPTVDCSYLVVSECSLDFDDIYKRSKFSTNGKASYDSFHISSTRVFRQDDFWIINRVGYENYLIAEFEETDFYPIMKSWNLTNDDTNFNSEIKTCVVICRSNMFPTVSPSFEPSRNPSMDPTFFTNVPSFAPTGMPISTPSISPTIPGISNHVIVFVFIFFFSGSEQIIEKSQQILYLNFSLHE